MYALGEPSGEGSTDGPPALGRGWGRAVDSSGGHLWVCNNKTINVIDCSEYFTLLSSFQLCRNPVR